MMGIIKWDVGKKLEQENGALQAENDMLSGQLAAAINEREGLRTQCRDMMALAWLLIWRTGGQKRFTEKEMIKVPADAELTKWMEPGGGIYVVKAGRKKKEKGDGSDGSDESKEKDEGRD